MLDELQSELEMPKCYVPRSGHVRTYLRTDYYYRERCEQPSHNVYAPASVRQRGIDLRVL